MKPNPPSTPQKLNKLSKPISPDQSPDIFSQNYDTYEDISNPIRLKSSDSSQILQPISGTRDDLEGRDVYDDLKAFKKNLTSEKVIITAKKSKFEKASNSDEEKILHQDEIYADHNEDDDNLELKSNPKARIRNTDSTNPTTVRSTRREESAPAKSTVTTFPRENSSTLPTGRFRGRGRSFAGRTTLIQRSRPTSPDKFVSISDTQETKNDWQTLIEYIQSQADEIEKSIRMLQDDQEKSRYEGLKKVSDCKKSLGAIKIKAEKMEGIDRRNGELITEQAAVIDSLGLTLLRKEKELAAQASTAAELKTENSSLKIKLKAETEKSNKLGNTATQTSKINDEATKALEKILSILEVSNSYQASNDSSPQNIVALVRDRLNFIKNYKAKDLFRSLGITFSESPSSETLEEELSQAVNLIKNDQSKRTERISDLENELRSQTLITSQLQAEAENKNSEIIALRQSLNVMQAGESSRELVVSELQRELRTKDEEVDTLRQSLSKARADADSFLRTTVQEQQLEIQSLQQNNNKLSNAISHLRETSDSEKRQLDKELLLSKAQIRDLITKCQDLEKQLDERPTREIVENEIAQNLGLIATAKTANTGENTSRFVGRIRSSIEGKDLKIAEQDVEIERLKKENSARGATSSPFNLEAAISEAAPILFSESRMTPVQSRNLITRELSSAVTKIFSHDLGDNEPTKRETFKLLFIKDNIRDKSNFSLSEKSVLLSVFSKDHFESFRAVFPRDNLSRTGLFESRDRLLIATLETAFTNIESNILSTTSFITRHIPRTEIISNSSKNLSQTGAKER